jgi:N4-(beta-N-acetylglucosaminyl)-L-asparaginase
MRLGSTPQEACEIAAKRVINLNFRSHHNRDHDYQVGFVAIDINGNIGASAVREGFEYALYRTGENKLYKSNHVINQFYDIGDL